MPSKRKFYKTTITMEVLSEVPIPEDQGLEVIVRGGYAGGYSLDYTRKTAEIDGPTAAKALEAQNSDPNFFGLTPEGDDEDGWENDDD